MAAPIIAARAEDSELWDVEGRRYIDFGGGIAVLNTGHRHPAVMKRVQEQLDAFTHTCFMVTPYAPFIELAEKLNAIAPISGDKKSLFVTTGAEAVENAIKIARAYTGRSDVICFQGGFHGRTTLTMAMTGKVVPYKTKFGPLPGGVWHVPFPVAHKGVTRRGHDPCHRMAVQGRRRAVARRGHRHRAGAGRRRLLCRAQGTDEGACARSATIMASCSSPMRSSRASGAPANGSPWSIWASSPIS